MNEIEETRGVPRNEKEEGGAGTIEEVGRCRTYADNDVIDCLVLGSEDHCARNAYTFIVEPKDEGKDARGRVIAYGWSPGYNCNGDKIGD